MATDHVIKISRPESKNDHTVIAGVITWNKGECKFQTTEAVLRTAALNRLDKHEQRQMICDTEDLLTARLRRYYRRCISRPVYYGKPEST